VSVRPPRHVAEPLLAPTAFTIGPTLPLSPETSGERDQGPAPGALRCVSTEAGGEGVLVSSEAVLTAEGLELPLLILVA